MGKLKDILDQLVVDCGEEYHKLHSGEQDFRLTNTRMNYYELQAVRHIKAMFPATKIIRVPVVKHSSDYARGYNSGYIAGKRSSSPSNSGVLNKEEIV